MSETNVADRGAEDAFHLQLFPDLVSFPADLLMFTAKYPHDPQQNNLQLVPFPFVLTV